MLRALWLLYDIPVSGVWYLYGVDKSGIEKCTASVLQL
jgi:hypothetical protein